MTRLTCSLLVLALCLSALTGTRAGGVRTTTTNNMNNNAPVETLYGSAPAAQTAEDQPASTQNAGTSQAAAPATVLPPSALQIFAVDIHFVAGYGLSDSYIAYHYCGSGPGVTQCAVYDGVGQDAKLIAVELIVPDTVFETYSDEEKSLWHSHAFAIQSGIFVLPELSAEQELATLAGLASTYGKVTDFYHPMTNGPTGTAQTAFGITSQDQLNQIAGLAQQMDQNLNLATTYQQRAEARQNLTAPASIQGQDPYHQSGLIPQYTTELFSVNKNTGAPL